MTQRRSVAILTMGSMLDHPIFHEMIAHERHASMIAGAEVAAVVRDARPKRVSVFARLLRIARQRPVAPARAHTPGTAPATTA